MRQADIDNWFTYHTPSTEQIGTYSVIRNTAKSLAQVFDEAVPDCADKTAAMRHLRETVMAMNLAIACYEVPAVYESGTIRQVITGK